MNIYRKPARSNR